MTRHVQQGRDFDVSTAWRSGMYKSFTLVSFVGLRRKIISHSVKLAIITKPPQVTFSLTEGDTQSSIYPSTNLRNMHVQTTILSMLAIPYLATAWTLQLGGDVWDGKGNQNCKGGFFHRKGEILSWDRAFISDCCVHLYQDAKCSHQVGYSCKDWDKTLGQTVGSFAVSDC
jgi:hypothetical protein